MIEKRYPRGLAVRVLTRVLSDHVHLDEALANEVTISSLSSVHMAWLQEICSGTLRWKGRLDLALDSMALKKKPSGWLRKVLLLACYQLIVQDRVPAPVVVSETVEEVRKKEGEAPARFANACLRKIAEHAGEWRTSAIPIGLKDQAQWASLPPWLWNRLVERHGLEWAKAYALASLERPALWIRSRDPDFRQMGSDSTSPGQMGWVEKGPVASSWRVIEGGAMGDKPGFKEGLFIVQDISNQKLICDVIACLNSSSRQANTLNDKEKWRERPLSVLDLCAAPGGKSVGMAWNGLHVTATDRVAQRVPLLLDTVRRTGAEVEVIPWEEALKREDQDLVWVDAPCSGTGILRRHPDVRWLRQEKELQTLVEDQRQLLKMAWEKVRPGGFLVYSVCSVLKEEGPDVLAATGLQEAQVKEWFLCPQEEPHGDGFWAALLLKRSLC